MNKIWEPGVRGTKARCDVEMLHNIPRSGGEEEDQKVRDVRELERNHPLKGETEYI